MQLFKLVVGRGALTRTTTAGSLIAWGFEPKLVHHARRNLIVHSVASQYQLFGKQAHTNQPIRGELVRFAGAFLLARPKPVQAFKLDGRRHRPKAIRNSVTIALKYGAKYSKYGLNALALAVERAKAQGYRQCIGLPPIRARARKSRRIVRPLALFHPYPSASGAKNPVGEVSINPAAQPDGKMMAGPLDW